MAQIETKLRTMEDKKAAGKINRVLMDNYSDEKTGVCNNVRKIMGTTPVHFTGLTMYISRAPAK